MIVKETPSKLAIVRSKLPSADYVVNAYTGCTHKCIYCYAEYMKKLSNHNEEWGEFIDIKVYDKINIPRDIKNKYVLVSSATDPYNHYEVKYRKTRQVLEALVDKNCHVGILTKSKYVLNDLEIFKKFSNIEIGVSMNTTDDNFRKIIEPEASSIEERINILKTLKENNIKNYLFMSPIFPQLTKYKEIIEETKDFVDYYGFENLNLRAGYKQKILDLIKINYQEFLIDYLNIYKRNHQIFWYDLEEEIAEYCKENKIKCKFFFYHEKKRKNNIKF